MPRGAAAAGAQAWLVVVRFVIVAISAVPYRKIYCSERGRSGVLISLCGSISA